MPVVNLTEIAKILAKLALVAVYFGILVNCLDLVVDGILHLVNTTSQAVGQVQGLNLGYIAHAIGFVDFINASLSSLYLVGSLYLSGQACILTLKYTNVIYSYILKI